MGEIDSFVECLHAELARFSGSVHGAVLITYGDQRPQILSFGWICPQECDKLSGRDIE